MSIPVTFAPQAGSDRFQVEVRVVPVATPVRPEAALVAVESDLLAGLVRRFWRLRARIQRFRRRRSRQRLQALRPLFLQ